MGKHGRGFWTRGDGLPYLQEIEAGRLTYKDVAEVAGVTTKAVNAVFWTYKRRKAGLPTRSKSERRGGAAVAAPTVFEDRRLQRLLNEVASYAGHLVGTHQQKLTARCEQLITENRHLRDEVETLKKQLTLQALSFKKQEQQFKSRAMQSAGVVHSETAERK